MMEFVQKIINICQRNIRKNLLNKVFECKKERERETISCSCFSGLLLQLVGSKFPFNSNIAGKLFWIGSNGIRRGKLSELNQKDSQIWIGAIYTA
jgi:hypothetical protein